MARRNRLAVKIDPREGVRAARAPDGQRFVARPVEVDEEAT